MSMNTKEKMLQELKTCGGYISGEELARRLGVSRTAVWKAVNALRAEGYSVGALTNRGYCLEQSDVLDEDSVRRYLDGRFSGLGLQVYAKTGSTNTLLKAQAENGESDPFVVIAAQQSEGRGRRGRSFFSPAGCGVYMSFLLRPGLDAQDAWLLTTAAAVAVVKTLADVAGAEAGIKWVNDVFIGGKKVCGILTEASVNVENGALDYAVVGIGINAYPPPEGLPAELAAVAGAVFDAPVPNGRSRIAAGIVNRYLALTEALPERGFVEEYKRCSLVTGRNVTVLRGDVKRNALALEIDDECRLRVRYTNGTEELLAAGEVSLRL